MNATRILFVAALCLFSVPAHTQKTKKPALPPGDLFFSLKGRPFALESVVPGIQGALLLTDEQKLKLGEALESTIWSQEVRSAGKALKSDPNATESQKAEAQKLVVSARRKLAELVAEILTKEQKSLILRIDDVSEEAHANARKGMEAEFTAAKADKVRQEELNRQLRQEVKAEFDRLLPQALNAEQRKGLEGAARLQLEAEQVSAKKGK